MFTEYRKIHIVVIAKLGINIYIYIQTAMLGTREYTLCSPFRRMHTILVIYVLYTYFITSIVLCVTFLVYTGLPLYCWCQCGILDHYRYGVMSVAMTFSCVCAREMLEAPPGTRVSAAG